MCYSPEADLVAGVVIGAVGMDAVLHADDRRYLPLAAIPLALAVHQLVEAVAWWGLEGTVPSAAGDFAVGTYLIIALGVVPILVPYAVMLSEPDPSRRASMLVFLAAGAIAAGLLVWGMAADGYSATIGGHYIAYDITAPGGGIAGALYVLAGCAPFLISSHRPLVVFGLVNVPVVFVLSAWLSAGLISLWCVWAAVSSLVIARHVRNMSSARSPTRARTLAAG